MNNGGGKWKMLIKNENSSFLFGRRYEATNKKRKRNLLWVLLGVSVISLLITPFVVTHCANVEEIKNNEKKIETLNWQVAKRKNEINLLKNDLDHKNRQIEALSSNIATEKEKLITAKSKLVALVGNSNEDFYPSANGENASESSIVGNLKAEISSLKSTIREKEAKISRLEKDLKTLKQDYESLKLKLKNVEKENVRLLNEIENIIAINKQKMDKLNLEISHLQGENEKKMNIIKEKETQIISLNSNISNLKAKIVQHENTIKENEAKISNLNSELKLNKEMLVNFFVDYRSTINELLLEIDKLKDSNNNFVNSLFTNINENLDPNNLDLAEIIKYSLPKDAYLTLINGEKIIIDESKELLISSSYVAWNSLDFEDKALLDKFFNFESNEYKEALISEVNSNNSYFKKHLKLVNLIKNAIINNTKVLNESLTKIIELNNERDEKLRKYLNVLINKIEEITGEKYHPTRDFGENGENAEGGLVYKLRSKIVNLENIIAINKSKLNEYVGNSETTFVAGENGENALENSLVYKLRKQIEEKTNLLNSKESELLNKNSELKNKALDIKKLEKEKVSLTSEISANKAEIKHLNDVKKQNEKNINELKSKNILLEKSGAEKDESIRKLNQLLAAYLSEISDLKTKLKHANNNNDEAQSTILEIKRKLKKLTGSDDPTFDVGISGENALEGSLIDKLNKIIKSKELSIARLENELEIEKTKSIELEKMWNKLNVREISNSSLLSSTRSTFYPEGHIWQGMVKNRYNTHFRKILHGFDSIDSDALAFDMYFSKDGQWNMSKILRAYKEKDKTLNPTTYFAEFVLKKDGFKTKVDIDQKIALLERRKFELLEGIQDLELEYADEDDIERLRVELREVESRIDRTIDKYLINRTDFSFESELTGKEHFTLLFAGIEHKNMTLSEIENNIRLFNEDESNQFIKTYRVKQLVASEKSSTFHFRESEIEIKWQPIIKVSRDESKIIFKTYALPLYITNRAGNDKPTSFTLSLFERKPMPDIEYIFADWWYEATHDRKVPTTVLKRYLIYDDDSGDSWGSTAEPKWEEKYEWDLNSFALQNMGNVYLYDAITVPKEFRSMSEHIPTSMVLQLK
ncbi:hypothetical protein [Mycoplasmopsis gallinacea]|uniref:Uncharacterized protein n=1 Tax=Mycoplasmopsis gallinacea TaxID=29556 RepID=A0A6H0V2K4_9BACT|nr:hypothetical protein [Mycoplasmopsis gallinacea]QIW62580.1 hypothetical protein GOQ20_04155 [Mycoplasmopsis gallinacea]